MAHNGRGRDAVHAGAGLGDDARLAHAARQHDLAEHVVDLVRAGVIEVLALEIDSCAAAVLGEPLGEIKRRRPADVSREMVVHLVLVFGIGLGVGISPLEIEDQRHQRLGDEPPAIESEMAALVGTAAIGVQRIWFGACAHEAMARVCEAADFAARMKFLTSSASLSPGARSTPEETSTRAAPVARWPRRPFRGQAAGERERRGEAFERQPIEGDAVAAGKRRGGVGLGIEQNMIGACGVGGGRGHVGGPGDRHGLHHRQAGAGLDRGDPRGRLAAM